MVVAVIPRLNYATATSAVPRIVSEGPLGPELAEGWIDDPLRPDGSRSCPCGARSAEQCSGIRWRSPMPAR
jgi:hypothetical protein